MAANEKLPSLQIGQPDGAYNALMNIYLSFDEESERQNGKIIIKALTDAVRMAVPIIEENMGRVMIVSEKGIIAAFSRSTVDAVISAVSICQKSQPYREIYKGIRISVGIGYGKIYMSLMSCGNLNTIVAVSDTLEVIRRLSTYCAASDASIIITDTAVGHVQGFGERFGSRKLGIMFNNRENREHIIYDVYDGDSTEKKYSKRRSRLMFETGVDHFLQNRILQARTCFIELLRYDRSDKMAKEYILKCDRVLSGAELQSQKYLEVW